MGPRIQDFGLFVRLCMVSIGFAMFLSVVVLVLCNWLVFGLFSMYFVCLALCFKCNLHANYIILHANCAIQCILKWFAL